MAKGTLGSVPWKSSGRQYRLCPRAIPPEEQRSPTLSSDSCPQLAGGCSCSTSTRPSSLGKGSRVLAAKPCQWDQNGKCPTRPSAHGVCCNAHVRTPSDRGREGWLSPRMREVLSFRHSKET